MQVLHASDIHKSFGTLEVLKGVSLQVKKGEIVAIIGPSGSGKSTFLRCLNLLETIDRGSIEIGGQCLVKTGPDGKASYAGARETAEIRRKIGMVFQNFNLFPHKSVMENLTLAPVLVQKMDLEQATANARTLLEKVGLEDKANNYPFELSGGQQQRVAIARALAMNPDILCFDEPTSALDTGLTGEDLKVMKDLAMEHMTMIVVTHEIGFAREVAHRVLFMAEGRIVEEGPAEEVLLNPREESTRAFLDTVLVAR